MSKNPNKPTISESPRWDGNYNAVLIAHSPNGMMEHIFVNDLGNQRFKIVRQPVDTPNLFFGDIVSAIRKDLPYPEVMEVVEASGYDAATITGIPRGQDRRILVERFSKFGFIEQLVDDVFVLSAPKEKWLEIFRLAAETKVQINEPWWMLSDEHAELNWA